jgi:hypothetical protein
MSAESMSRESTCRKAKVDRTTGTTLEHNGVLIEDAVTGTVASSP